MSVPEPSREPRHVLHVLNGAGGGAAMSTLALIEGLERFGTRSSAVCHSAGTSAELDRLRAATGGRLLVTPLYWWNRKIRTALWKRPIFELLQGARTGWARGSARRIARFAQQVGADLIHTNTILTPDGGLAARRLDLPHLWHVRELTGPGAPFQLRPRGERLARAIAALADCVVANSPSSAAPWRDLLDGEMLRVVPNAIDTDRFTRSTEMRARPVVAMVASLTSRVKNHPLFLEMAARIESEPIDLRIYGHDPCRGGELRSSAYCRELHDRIDRLGLRGRIAFPGFVERPEEIMRGIDLLVHPVGHESFGRIVVEAMAAGVPVIGIAAGGVGDIVRHGETGLLVPDGEPVAMADGLARAVDSLLADRSALRRLGDAAYDDARRHYSIAPHLERMWEAYALACARHATRRAKA